MLGLCIPTRYLKLCYYREREKAKKFKELKKNLVVRRKKKNFCTYFDLFLNN